MDKTTIKIRTANDWGPKTQKNRNIYLKFLTFQMDIPAIY